MFYSQSLLSRKGPLGNIWVAAHCYKRLRREQVTGTNISSTVDKIIPDAQLSYRVLAHLLIGVVRIFSKKVDYLFHDCNEVLIFLGRVFLTVHKNTSKREAGAQRQKPSSIKGAEEKALALELGGEDVFDPSEAIRTAHYGTAFSLPKTFALDSFDLEVQDEENHDLFRLEVEDESAKQSFSSKRHDDEMLARSDFYSGCFTPGEARLDFFPSCFTPVQDVTSFGMMDIDLEYGEWEHTNKSKESQNLDEVSKRSGARRSLFVSVENRAEPSEFLLADMSHRSPTVEGNAEFQTPVKVFTGVSSPEITVTTPAIRERQQMSGKRKCLFDDTIVLPNQTLREWIHSSSGLVSKKRKAPHSSLASWSLPKILNIESRLMEPLIPSVILEKSAVPLVRREPANAARKLDFGKEMSVETPPVEACSLDVPSANGAEEGTPQFFDNEISLPDIESNSREEEADNQDGWSARTRTVARYLYRCFEKEREGELHTSRILGGKNRSRCAQVFYETLVLKSRGCIDVKQEFPYGEIMLSATPALEEIFVSRSI